MDQIVITVPKVVSILIISLFIVGGTSMMIGEEKKAKWFRKRRKYTLFTRRGFMGEICHFGYPCTKEGSVVTLGMALAICLVVYLVLSFG